VMDFENRVHQNHSHLFSIHITNRIRHLSIFRFAIFITTGTLSIFVV
jgi:hypothetical protein